jgi:N utilization substance protein B
MGSRRQGREAALRMLYQWDLSDDPVERVIQLYFEGELTDEDPSLDPHARRFAERLVRRAASRRDELDALIVRGTEHWRIERFATVDRNVVRLALLELLEETDTPPAVVLDEAIELAKAYGGEESGAFVNGVLDGLRKRLESGELRV